jgi:hypothetical protein
MLRTIRSAEKAIIAAGHTVTHLDTLIPSLWETAILTWRYFVLDPQKTALKRVQASGEPWVPSIRVTAVPELAGPSATMDELFDINLERRKILRAWHDIVVQNKLDAIIIPPYQSTAVPHDTYGFPVYTTLANCLDWPTGSIPYLKANKALDKEFVRDVAYQPECKSFMILTDCRC